MQIVQLPSVNMSYFTQIRNIPALKHLHHQVGIDMTEAWNYCNIRGCSVAWM